MVFIIRLGAGELGEEGTRLPRKADTQPRPGPAAPENKSAIEEPEQGPVPEGMNASLSGLPPSQGLHEEEGNETWAQSRGVGSACLPPLGIGPCLWSLSCLWILSPLTFTTGRDIYGQQRCHFQGQLQSSQSS